MVAQAAEPTGQPTAQDGHHGESLPVFVDETGRRGRRLRLLGFAGAGLGLGYVGMLGLSLIGGPVEPSTVLGLPKLPVQGVQKVVERVASAGGEAGVTSDSGRSPARQTAVPPVVTAQPTSAASQPRTATSRSPSATPSPSAAAPSPSAARPATSTPLPSAAPQPTTTPAPTPGPTTAAPAPTTPAATPGPTTPGPTAPTPTSQPTGQ